MATVSMRADRSPIAHREGGSSGAGERNPIARVTGSATPVSSKSGAPQHTVLRGVRIPAREMLMPVRTYVDGFVPPEGDDADPVSALRTGVLEEYGRDEAAWHARESQLTEENTRIAYDLREAQAANWEMLGKLPATKANEPPTPVETPEKTQEDLRAKFFKPIEGR